MFSIERRQQIKTINYWFRTFQIRFIVKVYLISAAAAAVVVGTTTSTTWHLSRWFVQQYSVSNEIKERDVFVRSFVRSTASKGFDFFDLGPITQNFASFLGILEHGRKSAACHEVFK